MLDLMVEQNNTVVWPHTQGKCYLSELRSGPAEIGRISYVTFNSRETFCIHWLKVN